ncbi:MAG TPA: hypothetical protein VJV74_11530 [Terriglobia bacterium]|nr:hypothetical protein [Terriglobia bacterium]
MTRIEDCLAVNERVLRNLIAEVEGVLGVEAAFPVTIKAMEALQAITAVRERGLIAEAEREAERRSA